MIHLRRLQVVNERVNTDITYTPDGMDTAWKHATETMKTMKGDCEDYAIVKAFILKKQGESIDDMSIGIFRTPENGTHAMLMCKGEYTKGIFKRVTVPCVWILDNRVSAIWRLDQIYDKWILTKQVDGYIC